MEDMNVYDRVVELLRDIAVTRDDDFYLYAYYCIRHCGRSSLENFSEVLFSHKYYNLPSFASITRYRRKAQAEFEELRPSRSAKNRRKKAERDYRDKMRDLNAS